MPPRLKRPGDIGLSGHLRRPGAWTPEKGRWCEGAGRLPGERCSTLRRSTTSWGTVPRGPLLGPFTSLAEVDRDLEGNSSCGSQRFGWELRRKSNLQLLAVWSEERTLGLSPPQLTKVLSHSAGEREYLSLLSLQRVPYSACPHTWLPCLV